MPSPSSVSRTCCGGRRSWLTASSCWLGYSRLELPTRALSPADDVFRALPTVTGADVRSGERFLDNVPLEGPIPITVQDALAALRRNMSRRATVRGARRIDTWEYPEAALREAIVNALAHRDYSPNARGTQVQIEMYPDRLLIRNPGGLFGPVSVDDLGEDGVSSARNATLVAVPGHLSESRPDPDR